MALFDANWYLTHNPDVAAAVSAGLITARDHFEMYGILENRSPNALFDPEFYLAHNPDVAAAVNAGLLGATQHFMLYGQFEARPIHHVFNIGNYLAANPDVAAAAASGLSPVQHFLAWGIAEGRDMGNGVSLTAFADDPIFKSAIEAGDYPAAVQRVIDVAPTLPEFEAPPAPSPRPDPQPGPQPEPQPDPQPDPQPQPEPDPSGATVLSLQAPGWLGNNTKNTASFTLEFDSSVKLLKVALAGTGTFSQSISSSTSDGKTVAHVEISAWNKNAQGVFEVHMQAPEGAGANAQVHIRGFTQNDVTYPDITTSLAQSRLIDFKPVSATGTQFFAYDEVEAADLGTPYDALEPELAPAQNDLLPGWF